MDALDRAILDIIQTDFPLVPRPYAELARRLDADENEIFAHVSALRKEGVIRQLSANFWADKLGYVSTLCGAKVPEETLPSFIERVNAIPGVTHNYLRKHVFNVWFTLICQSRDEAARIVEALSRETGVLILNLPATEIYKINVNFQMQRKEEGKG
ncbi:MAG: AsnC family transcriptional regulator [Desulfovibrio sp.]|nr:AsnC family transcriptional regulator [Desulfovibrio sp.]